MELFGIIGWVSIPETVLQFVSFSVESLDQWIELNRLFWWITLGVGLGLYLIGTVFGGLGLYKLAKRAGIRHAWMGFFPFANTYLTGKLAGEARMFNAKVKRVGLWAMICEILFVALNIFYIVLQVLLLRPAYCTETLNSLGQPDYGIDVELIPVSLRWMVTASDALSITNYLFSIIIVFVFCMLFTAFFRKYYARSPFMMTFLSAVLPGRGFALFAVRNNPPVDYEALMRRRMQQQQQMYGNPYGNPYGGYGPQGGGQSAPPPPPEEPYGGEFGGTPSGNAPPDNDDPFSDF